MVDSRSMEHADIQNTIMDTGWVQFLDRNGSASCHMPMEVLRLRSMHLWMCSMCNKDDLMINNYLNYIT